MALFKISFNSNARDFAKYMSEVPEKTRVEIDRQLPTLRRNTKKVVQSELRGGKHGLDKGVYRKSFIINNFAQSKWEIGFQVYAQAPHYRLTHLLEDGHETKIFRWGQGELTRKGNKGMVNIGRRGANIKGASQHIAVGQKYAEDKIDEVFKQALNKSFERIKK